MEYLQNLIGTFAILFGLVVGSFLNVLIYRIPQKISVVRGSSFCTSCRNDLEWIDMIPVFSYLFIGGKCRHCKAGISIRYPIIELLNALCYLLIYLTFGLQLITLLYSIVASCLIALSMIDIDTKEIPDRFNIIIFACGLIAMLFLKEGVHVGAISFSSRLIGFFCISIPMLGLALLTNGIGEGDIKLFAVCGFLLGWRLILMVMLFSSVLAAFYGMFLMIAKKAERTSQLAFGPFISFSVMIAMLYGEKLISWYMGLISSIV